MNRPVVVIGMGELGELFSRGFLKMAHPVYPVLRGMDMSAIAKQMPEPELVLLAVGEDDLQSVLSRLPQDWHSSVALLQNELVPEAWESQGLENPTVIVVWFDKKKDRPFVNVLPTVVSGPGAELIHGSLEIIGVPCREVPAHESVYEMVRKNLYILTINIAGIISRSTVSELWTQHHQLAENVANEVLDIQECLVGAAVPRIRLMEGLLEAFEGDPDHICMGRSAPVRLHRAIAQARSAGISTPVLDQIAAIF